MIKPSAYFYTRKHFLSVVEVLPRDLFVCSAERDMVKTYGIGHRLLEKVWMDAVFSFCLH